MENHKLSDLYIDNKGRLRIRNTGNLEVIGIKIHTGFEYLSAPWDDENEDPPVIFLVVPFFTGFFR